MSSEQTIIIRYAVPADAVAMSVFGAQTFRETFGPYTPPEDMALFLAERYHPEAQAAEIADPDCTILLAEATSPRGDPRIVGQIYLVRSIPLPVVQGAEPFELKRLYVDREWHGRGVAHTLMSEFFRHAVDRKAETVWLTVWEHNARAIAFYLKYGFKGIGEHLFPVGNDPQIDIVMSRPVGLGSSGR